MKRVIITGANGFIGSHLTNFLSGEGIKVYAVVRDHTSDIQRINQNAHVNMVYCNLEDVSTLPDVLADREIDVFFHLGWTGVSGAQSRDYLSQIKNIEYSCNCARVCTELGCKTFVFASSIWEYECYHVMRRLDSVKSSMVYSTAKIAADFMARTLCNGLGIDYISAIITNVYGPQESSPRLINSTIRKLLQGEDTQFTSCTQMYDFIYIDDAVQAFYYLGRSGKNNKSYYIGSLHPRPLLEFLVELRDSIDSSLPLGIGKLEHQGIDLDYHMFDVNALKTDTGFEPKISFEDGVARTVEWIRSEEGIVRVGDNVQI